MSKFPINLVHFTSSLKVGGAEVVLCDLIEHLPADQFKHTVLYIHDGPNHARLRAFGISTYQVRGLLCIYDPIFFMRLVRLLYQLKPDVLHTLLWAANVSGRVVAKFLRIPCVSVLHNNLDQDGAVRNLLDRLTLPLADKIIAVSPGVAQSFTKKYKTTWMSAKKVEVIRNGIATETVQARAQLQAVKRQHLGLSANQWVIGSVGRFVPVKNYPLLIESFSAVYVLHPQARLVLVGSGPEEYNLKNLAVELGVARVVIFVVGQPAHGYYPLFDCFVQSSDKEGLSIALLEAMSFALPVVVMGTENEHSVVRNGSNGLIVPAGDCQQLALALIKLFNNSVSCSQLGDVAKQDVTQNYTVGAMAQSYQSLFIQMCRNYYKNHN